MQVLSIFLSKIAIHFYSECHKEVGYSWTDYGCKVFKVIIGGGKIRSSSSVGIAKVIEICILQW